MNSRVWPNAAKPSRFKRLGFVLAFVVVALATSAGPAQADDTECFLFATGVHDNIVVPEGSACSIGPAFVQGNVICEPESVCFVGTLGSTTVRGSVLCEENAICFVDDSTVFGNVQCDRCFELDVGLAGPMDIRGNVQSTSSAFGSVIRNSTVGGDVEFEGTGQLFELSDSIVGGNVQIGKTVLMLPAVLLEGLDITDNEIEGDVQVVEASAADHAIVDNEVGHNLQFFKNTGLSDISGNTILGNLQCKENVPPPTGTGNVAKQKEEQCAGL